jgi:hypothetical protein
MEDFTWIQDTFIHCHYSIILDEDRFFVGRLVATYLVPHELPTTVGMKKLRYIYATVDEKPKHPSLPRF